MASPPTLTHWLNGQTVNSASSDFADVFNPSTGQRIGRVPLAVPAEIEAAVANALRAQQEWADVPIIDRARCMFRFRERLESDFEDFAALITRENGKTLAESRAELRRGIEVVEFACGIPSLAMGQVLSQIARDVDSDVQRHPLGVCVGITPYNFPAMVPLWMIPIAVVCGNAFILKPSEKVPLSALRLASLLHESDCPAGVFQVLHGDRTCVDGLIEHPDVAAISFVGSSSAARDVYQRGTAAGKRVQAAGGAKNFCIVMPDADLDMTVEALSTAAFGCGGQRCMATSIAVPVGSVGDTLVRELTDFAGRLKVGPTDSDEAVDIGPLIRSEHVERVQRCVSEARAEGAAVALDGTALPPHPGFLLGPSIVDRVTPQMSAAREEIFGPLLSVIRATTLDEAIALSRTCRYGNGASIFTRDGFAARRFRDGFQAGMIGINVGVPAPMAWFPFTGWKGSFFGDLHVQGEEGIHFYTRQKVTLTRWPETGSNDAADPIWRST